MDQAAFLAEAKAGKASGIYILYGPEALLRDRALDALRSGEPPPGFQVLRVSPSETPWTGIADELYTPPFLGGRKLVVLADEGNFIHNHLAQIRDYVKAPSPSSVLVALVPSEKAPALPETSGLRLLACPSLRRDDLVRWVQSEIRRWGKAPDRGAVEHLARHGGGSLLEISRQIENVCQYVGPRSGVTEEDARRLVRSEPSHEIYELALAAASKQPGRALEIVHRLLASGEPPPVLLWRLAWQYRKLVEAKKLLESGRRRFEVTSLLQITYYPDEFLRLVDRHSLEELLEKHGALLAADLALKTSGGDERAVMEGLVLRLAAEPAPAR